jgi:hypothetical protein
MVEIPVEGGPLRVAIMILVGEKEIVSREKEEIMMGGFRVEKEVVMVLGVALLLEKKLIAHLLMKEDMCGLIYMLKILFQSC